MESPDGNHAAKLLKAQTHIWNHIFNFINSMSLKCVVDLGIPDVIHNYGQPMPLSNLIASLPIHPSKTHSVHRLMRILIHSGFFSQHNVTENELEVEYVLTDASILLLKNHPLSVTPFLHAMLDPILTKPWNQFSTWFKNVDPTPFETEHGTLLWDCAGREPKLNHMFNDAMASDARLVTSLVTEKCKGVFTGLESLVDVGGGTGTMAKAIAKSLPQLKCTVLVTEKCKGVFTGLESLVDVGGGTGTMAKAIAKSLPQLKCTVFDLPHVISGLQGSENLKYVGGNMFEAIPPADAIMLKWILHDWNDKECVEILKKCKEAITRKGKEGKVIIIDKVMENGKKDDESVETQLFFDMLMMVLVTGKERNEKEWVKLITSAGFSDYKITPVLGLRSFIEIFP